MPSTRSTSNVQHKYPLWQPDVVYFPMFLPRLSSPLSAPPSLPARRWRELWEAQEEDDEEEGSEAGVEVDAENVQRCTETEEELVEVREPDRALGSSDPTPPPTPPRKFPIKKVSN